MTDVCMFKDGTEAVIFVNEYNIVSLEIKSKAINDNGMCEMFTITSSGLPEDFVFNVFVDGEKPVDLYPLSGLTSVREVVKIQLYRISTSEKKDLWLE